MSASYQASMRLSYSVAASYFISRYNAGFSIGANDISVLGSAQYRLTRKATIAGTYSHGNYHYQHGAGDSNVDSVFGTLGYTLGNRWSLSVSGGMSRSSGNGTVRIPLNLQIGQQIVTVYATGRYQSTSYVPYYQGTVTRLMRHSSVGVSAGEGVTPGNGLFLTSRNINVNGLFVQEFRRSNISGGAYYNRLSSVSNTVTEQSNTRGLDVSYSYNLIRHVGVNARYDYINFSSFGSYGGRADNRLTFGVYFESKDIPLGLF
ncbi:MAG: hypothetical protein JO061_13170 [Acidobacteriaceae bacterium]|nr:hypothetical protein [Acidobacteriaceae bacterium]